MSNPWARLAICEAYSDVTAALDSAELEVETKQVTRIPSNKFDLDVDTAQKVLKLMEALDDHDDVQNASANFNIPDEAMAELAET